MKGHMPDQRRVVEYRSHGPVCDTCAYINVRDRGVVIFLLANLSKTANTKTDIKLHIMSIQYKQLTSPCVRLPLDRFEQASKSVEGLRAHWG